MTPDEIQTALGRANRIIKYDYHPNADATIVARALLALTEQQPEPVSEDTLTKFLYDTALANLLDIDGDTPCVLAVELRRRYVITPKPETEATVPIGGYQLAGNPHDQNGGAV